MDGHGHDQFEEFRRTFDAAFPDLERTNLLPFATEDGDFVCSLDTRRATHVGEFKGIAPTGPATIRLAALVVRDGRRRVGGRG